MGHHIAVENHPLVWTEDPEEEQSFHSVRVPATCGGTKTTHPPRGRLVEKGKTTHPPRGRLVEKVLVRRRKEQEQEQNLWRA